MQFKLLEEYIDTGCTEKAIEMIKELGRKEDTSSVDFLIRHLETTESHVLRNLCP